MVVGGHRPALAGFALLGLFGILVACTGLSSETCTAGDWRAIGFTDGVKGRGADLFEDHVRACARSGVTPDKAAWSEGNAAGLKQYCVPTNIYKAARIGRKFPQVCTGPDQASLQPAYDHGRRYYEIDRELDFEYMDLREGDNLPSGAALVPARIRTLEREQRYYASWPPLY